MKNEVLELFLWVSLLQFYLRRKENDSRQYTEGKTGRNWCKIEQKEEPKGKNKYRFFVFVFVLFCFVFLFIAFYLLYKKKAGYLFS